MGEQSGRGCAVAVSTTVGWVLSCPVGNLRKERLSSIQFQFTHVLRVDSGNTDDNTLYKDFEKLWDLDSTGIREDTVHEAFEKNVSFEDGRYCVYLAFEGAPQVVA